MKANQQHVLGIDVGWSRAKKSTGVCLFSWDANSASATFRRVGKNDRDVERDIKDLVGTAVLRAVAIDGPIAPGFGEIGLYRDAEMMLTRGFQRHVGKPGQASSGNGRNLNRVANRVATVLQQTGRVADATHQAKIDACAIVEAFPTSFLGVMLDEESIPAAGARSDAYFEHLLGPDCPRPTPPPENRLAEFTRRLLPDCNVDVEFSAIENHEDRAAIVCALTALCVATRNYVAVGDARHGYIVLPPRAKNDQPGLQRWAWELLQANRPTDSQDAIIEEME